MRVRTCAPLFGIWGTVGQIALKFCVLYERNQLIVLHQLWTEHTCTCARAHPNFIARERLDGFYRNLTHNLVAE